MAFSVVGGGLSTYIPSTNDLATGALQVEFTRSVNTFPLTRYAQIVPVSKMTGFYLRQDATDNVRVTDQNEFIWPLGNDRPTGKQNAFDFFQYTTQRFAFPFYIPQETTQQAAWDVVAQHARSRAQLAMTRRAMSAATALSTAGNWGTNYTTAAGSNGPAGSGWTATGSWDGSTVANKYIQKSIQQAMQIVGRTTGGAVSPSNLILVISPNVATKVAQSPEVQEFTKYNPSSPSFLQGSDTYSRWGIPPTLFGLADVVVDDSVKVTSKKGASSTTYDYVLGNGAYFVSRPGGLVGVEGANSFSTVQIFAYEDMTVEQFNDPMNRRIEGRVIDNSTTEIVAPVSGFAVLNALA
jgi:hypothetical protein